MNIVYIMADDHAPHGLGCYGSRMALTPHIDRLAVQGMRFTRAYDTIALCGPSRASLLTGTYSHINGFKHNEGEPFDGSQPTFPKYLQDVGYRTGIFGKWHLESMPTGFDHYSVIPGHGRFWDCPFRQTGKPWDEGEVVPGYLTDVITDQAIDWMEAQRENDNSFCVLIHHKAPHAPHEYPKRYESLFIDDLPEPETFDDDWVGREALRMSSGVWSKFSNIMESDLYGNERDHLGALDRSDSDFAHRAYQMFMKGYLRLVASLDDNVGRVLDYLDKSGLAGNTLVVYTSDNGFFLGDHGLYNKMWMYEEAMGLPLVARLPGRIPAGAVSDEMVSLIDIAPTLLEFAKADIPGRFQGRSLMSILDGNPPTKVREVHYYHYYKQFEVPSQCGIRTRDHKLICFYELEDPARWELYDLRSDPRELRNLLSPAHATPGHCDTFEHMKSRLLQEAMRYQDPVVDHL